MDFGSKAIIAQAVGQISFAVLTNGGSHEDVAAVLRKAADKQELKADRPGLARYLNGEQSCG